MENEGRDLIIVEEEAPLARVWDYDASVKEWGNLAKNVRVHGARALTAVRDAHHFLYADSRKKQGRKWEGKTFAGWCEDVGYSGQTCVNWLKHYFPAYYEGYQIAKSKNFDFPLVSEEDTGVITAGGKERKVTGYVRPVGGSVIDKGHDPFLKGGDAIERAKNRRRLLFLADKFLNHRQNSFFQSHYIRGKTPEEIAAYYNQDSREEPLTADGVYRNLRRIRWIIERVFAYLIVHRVHKKKAKALTPDELRADAGWIEVQKYTWRGAPEE